MPQNKSAYTRYLILDECLRSQFGRYTLSSLLEKLNEKLIDKGLGTIGRTQFYGDLNYLEYDLGAPIVRESFGKSKIIKYSDRNFSIRNQKIDKALVQNLRDSLFTLLQFKGLNQLEELEELLPKLDKEFGLDSTSENVIAFEENQYLKGLEHLNPLIANIKNKTQLTITYQNFKSQEPFIWDVSPYFLKRYNQRWFLFGQVKGFKSLTNLALDRIEKIEASTSKFDLNTEYNWEEYFDDMIGVSKSPGDQLEKIWLKFSSERAPYIKTKPLHGSQKPIQEDESGLIVQIEVVQNNELESLILSYGGSCEILKPQSLRERIIKRIREYNY